MGYLFPGGLQGIAFVMNTSSFFKFIDCSIFSNKIPILSHKINDKYLFNLPLFLQQCLKNAEIVNIGNVELDTYTNPHLFFSHRRSSHKNMNETGRQISVIGILE